MNAIFLNLQDTTALSDSTVVELVKVINTCQPCVKEVETNWADVQITFIICVAIVIIALSAMCTIIYWKWAEIKAAENEREFKKKKEEEESKRKQKSDLMDKKLQVLCELCYDNKENEPKKIVKQFVDSDLCQEIKKYFEVIDNYIDAVKSSQKPSDDEKHKSQHN